MKKGKRRVAAMFLSLCMALSLVTVVPVKAAPATSGENGEKVYYYDVNLKSAGLVLFTDVNFDNQGSILGFNHGSSADDVLANDDEPHVTVYDVLRAYVAWYTPGGDNGAGTIEPLTEEQIGNITTSKGLTVEPINCEQVGFEQYKDGWVDITVDKAGNFEMTYDNSTVTVIGDNPDTGWFTAKPTANNFLESYINDWPGGERFEYTNKNRTVYFVMENPQRVDEVLANDESEDDGVIQKYQFIDEKGDPSKNIVLCKNMQKEGDEEPSFVKVAEDDYAKIERVDSLIEGYDMYALTLGSEYDGSGLVVRLKSVRREWVDEHEENDKVVEGHYAEEYTDCYDKDVWLNCQEKIVGLALDWPINHDDPDDTRESYEGSKVIESQMNNASDENDTHEIMLVVDKEPVKVSSAKVKFGSMVDTVPLEGGLLRYHFDKIGEYTISIGDGEDDSAIFNSLPKPIGFYTASGNESDNDAFIADNNIVLGKGVESKVYFYVNTNENIGYWDGSSSTPYAYVADSYEAKARKGDEELKTVDNIVATQVQDKDNWYEIVLSDDLDYDNIQITAGASNGHDEEPYNCTLYIDLIDQDAVWYKYVPTDGLLNNDSAIGKATEGVIDYDRNELLSFENTDNFSFYIQTTSYDANSGAVVNKKFENIDAGKLQLLYGHRDENRRLIFEEPGEQDYSVKDALKTGYAEIVGVENGVITIYSDVEETYDIYYGEGENPAYIGMIHAHAAGMAFYSSKQNKGRPDFDEPSNYLKAGMISYKEMQPSDNTELYVYAWSWNGTAWSKEDGDSDQDYFNKLMEDETISEKFPNIEIGESEGLSNELAAQLIGVYNAAPEDDEIAGQLGEFCNVMDFESFDIKAYDADGKELKGYVSYTPMYDSKFNNVIVGEKITLTDVVTKPFKIVATMSPHSEKIGELLKNNWPGGRSAWTWRDKGDITTIEYDVAVDPFTGIKVTKAPTKTSYTEGDKLDVTGLEVAGVYKDGSTYALKADDYTVTPSVALTTADKKATVTYKNNSKLTAAYDITVAAKAVEPTSQESTDTKAADDKAAADAVTTAINALPANIATTDEAAITGARKSYDALTADQKALVSADVLKKLTDAETALAKVKAPAEVGTTITDTSAGGTVTATYTVTEKSEGAGDAGEVTYAGESADSTATSVVIPTTVTGADGTVYEVTKIADNALKDNKTVKEVTVGDNIEEIGAGAFQNATNLTTVKVGKKVTAIDKNAFAGCTKLKKFKATGSAVKTIGDGAFSGNKAMTSVDLSKSKVTTIGKNAFKGNKKMKELKIDGNKLKKVGKGALSGIKKKATITIGAKDKKTYNKAVKLFKKSGAKNVKYKFKKKK